MVQNGGASIWLDCSCLELVLSFHAGFTGDLPIFEPFAA